MNFTISELKKHLGPGLGLRKNKYLLELPIPTVSGETINILCQSAGLPERNISTVEVWHKGRKYVVRGETDFGNEYEISIVDDDQMSIRKLFDVWLKSIDNTRPDKNSSILGASFEEISPNLIGELSSGVKLAGMVKNVLSSPSSFANFAIAQLDSSQGLAAATYQVDVNIWQIDNNHNPVYGYKLQNAFPKGIGIVTLDDTEENTLSQFSVTLAFSEFIPLYGTKEDLTRAVIGDQTADLASGFVNVFGQ
jgi:hypothetical protein